MYMTWIIEELTETLNPETNANDLLRLPDTHLSMALKIPAIYYKPLDATKEIVPGLFTWKCRIFIFIHHLQSWL